ncbi:sigma-70 family RNA polymerase sigma factor [Sporichthya polymorpha]|uniref:sigma-70 family RNA polymerase sigma factor n=1 Tax=Sporichthya polymorpha TaxID=35751 RepID=UPI000365A976
MVRENLPLVGYLVSEVLAKVPAHVSRAELTSAGLAALAFAVRAYDEDRGVPFPRFASIRIRGALIDELRNTDWASRSVRAKARRQEAVVAQLTTELGRTPTDVELATALGVEVSEIADGRHDVHRAVVLSLDGFADPESVETLAPSSEAGPEDQLLAHERIGYLHDAVLTLPERLRIVVTQYYFEERPMAETAAQLGVTESRVSQMRAEALTLLRGGLNAALTEERPAPTAASTGRAAKRHEAYYAAVAARSDYRSRLSARPVDTRPRTGEQKTA